jgi:hypothetical protein
MVTALQIEQMSRAEQLQAMEALWTALSRTESLVDSPTWHADVLKETEARHAAGQEKMTEWEAAKVKLRRRFE